MDTTRHHDQMAPPTQHAHASSPESQPPFPIHPTYPHRQPTALPAPYSSPYSIQQPSQPNQHAHPTFPGQPFPAVEYNHNPPAAPPHQQSPSLTPLSPLSLPPPRLPVPFLNAPPAGTYPHMRARTLLDLGRGAGVGVSFPGPVGRDAFGWWPGGGRAEPFGDGMPWRGAGPDAQAMAASYGAGGGGEAVSGYRHERAASEAGQPPSILAPIAAPDAGAAGSRLWPSTASIPTPIPTQTSASAPPPLFATLLSACTAAARAYYQSQCTSAFTRTCTRVRHSHVPRWHPYTRPHSTRQGPGPKPDSRCQHHHCLQGACIDAYNQHIPAHMPPPHALPDYLACIASLAWERARQVGDHAAELEAVHRMGNLYAWGERVVEAARKEGGEDGRWEERREEETEEEEAAEEEEEEDDEDDEDEETEEEGSEEETEGRRPDKRLDEAVDETAGWRCANPSSWQNSATKPSHVSEQSDDSLPCIPCMKGASKAARLSHQEERHGGDTNDGHAAHDNEPPPPAHSTLPQEPRPTPGTQCRHGETTAAITIQARRERRRAARMRRAGRPAAADGTGDREAAWRIVLAARDLAAWLLNEEAKREIDGAWEEFCGGGR